MDDLYELAKGFDIISFDIFDTLITRYVLMPTDVFRLVETASVNLHQFGNDFSRYRILAEQKCYEELGDKVTLDAIYERLQSEAGYTLMQCETLKALEKDFELESVIPRRDMRQLFLKLCHEGKKIVLCSDMYLDAVFIQKLLSKCGYPDNLEIIVSNEIEKGKGNGALWRHFFSKYEGKTTFHIGDNKNSDQIQVERLGHKAFHVDSSFDLFVASGYYKYLSKYIDNDIGHRLILGTFVNDVMFNSPFGKGMDLQKLSAIWMGPVLSSFVEWLVEKKDDSHLLFVTREGYILKPAYETFCKGLGIPPQTNSLFYASRAATGAATVTSEEDLDDIFRLDYKGNFRTLIRARLNFMLPQEDRQYDTAIKLPEQKEFVKRLLSPFLQQIFKDNMLQKEAYCQYIQEIQKSPEDKFTVVDVGYNGTIQYNLAKIIEKKVAGWYLFLNRNPLPRLIDCECDGMCDVTKEFQPIYENLLFLEGVLQVPYGQLQKMVLDKKNKIQYYYEDNAVVSNILSNAQNSMLEYVSLLAKWKQLLQQRNLYDIKLAQAIWIYMLRYDDIPESLINSFHLTDDFEGNSEWKYDNKKRLWKSENNIAPLVIPISHDTTYLKYRIKLLVKKYIPRIFYEYSRLIWMRYIK